MGLSRLRKKIKNSILNPKIAVRQATTTLKAGLSGDTDSKRANLRAFHTTTFEPFSPAAQKIITAAELSRSSDPNIQAEGETLRNEADAMTLKQGKIGLATAAVVVGGYALGGASVGSALPSGATIAKTGAGLLVSEIQKRREGTDPNGTADTSEPNGENYFSRGYADRTVDSNTRDSFYASIGRGGAGGTVASASSCACVGGDAGPWVLLIGILVGVFVYLIRRKKRDG